MKTDFLSQFTKGNRPSQPHKALTTLRFLSRSFTHSKDRFKEKFQSRPENPVDHHYLRCYIHTYLLFKSQNPE
ncbi:hypothetical protein LR48_Vigan2353s000100 [Vigna angularis]|nr:hypothetical protein LR48_Vigan2353s000100 [Vigna angularis]